MFDLGLCSYCTLPTGSEDQKECWHSQRENKYLKIGFGLLNLLRQHKQNLSLVCILGVHIVAFTIVASVIWESFIGHILKLKQKTNQKWDSYTPIVAYIPFFLLCFAYISPPPPFFCGYFHNKWNACCPLTISTSRPIPWFPGRF